MYYNKAPFFLGLVTTDYCQLKCRHCYFGYKNRERELSFSSSKIIVDKFFKLRQMFLDNGYASEKTTLNLLGGEPLLNKDLHKFIKMFSPKYDKTKLTSNGIIYSKEICDLLINYSPRAIYQISLDGMKESHEYIRGSDTFYKTVKTIESIKKYFPNLIVQIACNFNNINYKDLLPLTKFVKELGVNNIMFDRYIPYSNTNELKVLTKEEYISVIRDMVEADKLYTDNNFKVVMSRSMQPNNDYVCQAAIGFQVSNTNGDRYLCCRYQIKSGNWFTDDVNKLMYDSLEKKEKYLSTPFECLDCKNVYNCNGGMRCLTHTITGSIDKRDIHCFRYTKSK